MKPNSFIVFFYILALLSLLGTCKGDLNVGISTAAPFMVNSKGGEKSSALCKLSGMYCPGDHPICCGESLAAYCVSAGAKCCTSLSGLTRSACSFGEQCCAGQATTKCCAMGSSCHLRLNSNGQLAPLCLADKCSALNTAEDCAGDGECGWCCAERKCKLLASPNESEPNVCVDGIAPIAYGQTCPSKCSYATTCKQCISDYKDVDDEGCAWCCSSMSCVPKGSSATYENTCENSQILTDFTTCGNCMYGGGGVEQNVSDFFSQFLSVFFTGVLLIISSFVLIAAFRVVIGHCCDLDTDADSGILIDPQEHVRRHGFQLTDQEASCPATHHRRAAAAANGTAVPVVRRCCGCHAAISVETLEEYLPHLLTTPDGAACATTSIPVQDEGEAHGEEESHVAREQQEANTDATAATSKTASEGRTAVLLLPCDPSLVL
ncbi:hypothetical protein STCU_10889 [Strigomonas culicis]|uniref:Uncharacterized protein n=1 Tax=Strigomonas culicis TaxID=28005 RepID=S9TKV4_9TRYP|nr:hypothetical protein STCU_10889 [Strigomonas culicis]|eukprot:EPY16958.1 hypothetical protein STCU_10889 [Strigomonas culicis]